MIICGIETSCDDTSIAFVKDGKYILTNVTFSQTKSHEIFSGVVPEIASREHLKNIDKTFILALQNAQISLNDIDIISVTTFPGLVGSLVIGLNFAKGLSLKLNKPLISVNHLLAHIYAANFKKEIKFPCIALLISGGHTAILKMDNFIDYEILGKTFDDSCGEAFDKIAKYFELGYPGGPIIDKLAKFGNSNSYNFPLTVSNVEKYGLNFSFSGLKTSVIYFRDKYKTENKNGKNYTSEDFLKNNLKDNLNLENDSLYQKYLQHQDLLIKKGILNKNENLFDILSSFQNTISSILTLKLEQALIKYQTIKTLVIAGGSSANSEIRNKILSLSEKFNIEVIFPDINLCMDNGAMVAGIAYEYYKNNIFTDYDINVNPKIDLLKRGS